MYSRLIYVLLGFFLSLFAALVVAQDRLGVPSEHAGLVARINLEESSEIEEALLRAEAFYFQNEMEMEYPPIAFVIHGPEVAVFYKENYQQFKSIVDLAAKLSSFNVIDVKVCEASSRRFGLEGKSLYPFVGTVPFGPVEVKRLLEDEQYTYF